MGNIHCALRETNDFLGKKAIVWKIPEGALCEVEPTGLVNAKQHRPISLLEHAARDINEGIGIGLEVPKEKKPKMQGHVGKVQDAASSILNLSREDTEMLWGLSAMCFTNMSYTNEFTNETHRGGLIRILFTEKTAFFQVLFLFGHEYGDTHFVGFEAPLEELISGKGFWKYDEFRNFPMDILIPDYEDGWKYKPWSLEGYGKLLQRWPTNGSRKGFYKSGRDVIFAGTRKLFHKILHA